MCLGAGRLSGWLAAWLARPPCWPSGCQAAGPPGRRAGSGHYMTYTSPNALVAFPSKVPCRLAVIRHGNHARHRADWLVITSAGQSVCLSLHAAVQRRRPNHLHMATAHAAVWGAAIVPAVCQATADKTCLGSQGGLKASQRDRSRPSRPI